MVYLKYFLLILTFTTCTLLPAFSEAHPVIYKGGWMIHSRISSDRIDGHVAYSLTHRFALGVRYARIEQQNQTASSVWPQLGFLLKRWNMDAAQANIYFFGGMGVQDFRGSQALIGSLGAQADYETRRIYTSIRGETLLSTLDAHSHRVTAKAGIAPYLADYDQLNTWIIGVVSYRPGTDEVVRFAPALRFFYSRYFLEAGSTFTGKWFVNLMTHF